MSTPSLSRAPNAVLALANGRIFYGRSVGAPACVRNGEVVFNTAMSGYQEILTDPSYHRQMVVFTAPHIGNTGINAEDIESAKIHAAGIIIHQLPIRHSNWRALHTLSDYLAQQGVPGIADVDTRALTRLLRTEGAMGGAIAVLGADGINDVKSLADLAFGRARAFGTMSGQALAYEVSGTEPMHWHEGAWSLSGYANTTNTDTAHQPLVAVLDFGVKYNILRRLIAHGCRVKVFPAQTNASAILADKPSGILLANGPGDPEPCESAIATIRTLMQEKIPIFGICLGHQLLGLAGGARTEKMKFGHHGANHPVIDVADKRVFITSQNHGFAVSESSLPTDWLVTHRSLFDGSVQGIAHKTLPFFGFQGHPEASPGPQDIDGLFTRFVSRLSHQAS